MRDDNTNDGIRLPTASNYYPGRLVEAEANLKRIQAMTLEEAEIAANEEHARIIKDAQEGIARLKSEHEKFSAMLVKAEAWIAPTEDHKKLKEFMIYQLKREVQDSSEPSYYDMWLATKKSTANEWLTEATQDAIDEIKRIKKHIEDDQKDIRFATEWIMQLQHSVPLPEKKSK